jgi:hypothetical protein
VIIEFLAVASRPTSEALDLIADGAVMPLDVTDADADAGTDTGAGAGSFGALATLVDRP